jgi:hypothetical protein
VLTYSAEADAAAPERKTTSTMPPSSRRLSKGTLVSRIVVFWLPPSKETVTWMDKLAKVRPSAETRPAIATDSVMTGSGLEAVGVPGLEVE